MLACQPRGGRATTRGQGFSLRYDPACYGPEVAITREPRLTEAEVGTDIPVDVAPARARFGLQALAPAFLDRHSDWSREAWVQVIPLRDPSVGDFAKAYPDLQACAGELGGILARGRLAPGRPLPVWNCVDCEETMHAKARILTGPWCSGVQYLTTYVQDSEPVGNGGLVYVFQGISRDGRSYVAVQVPVAHPALPVPWPGLDQGTGERPDAYYARAQARLDALPDRSFFPPLDTLAAMVRSLRPER
jgi:hypothetical protein